MRKLWYRVWKMVLFYANFFVKTNNVQQMRQIFRYELYYHLKKSEVSIMLCCQLHHMFNLLHSSINQELFEMLAPLQSKQPLWNSKREIIFITKVSYHVLLLLVKMNRTWNCGPHLLLCHYYNAVLLIVRYCMMKNVQFLVVVLLLLF